jgi:voltage-gated potassium channel
MAESTKSRMRTLRELEKHLEIPMLVLAVVWIALIILEVAIGLPPFLRGVGYVIWAIFILEFALRFWIAPHKFRFLEKNWLSLIALVVPAFRVFRVFQAIRLLQVAQVSRGLSLVRVVAAANRGMGALGRTLGRRGFGYVGLATLIVAVLGAAGIYQFEPGQFKDYPDALWWSTMVIATMGSQYWPQSNEGRILTVMLAAYGLAILGYLAATLASLFVDQDVKHTKDDVSLKSLQSEVRALREEVRHLREPSSAEEEMRRKVSLE